jgi:uncharacterized protein YoxC
MVIISIAVAVIAVTFVVLALFAIPAIVEIRKSATELRALAGRLESEINPVLHELRSTLADVKVMTEGTSQKIEHLYDFLEVVGDTGRNLRIINSVIGSVAGAVAGPSLWMTGAKAASKLIIDKLTSKKGDKKHG